MVVVVLVVVVVVVAVGLVVVVVLVSTCNAEDHGQLPWGRNSSSDILAGICQKLKISSSDNVGNCCLVIHLLLGAVAMGALSPDGIAVTHTAFLLKYLRSNIMRRDEEVVPEFLSAFGLASRLNIRMIMRYDKTLCVSSQTFGNPTKKPLFICHLGSHFFLAWKI